MAAKVSAGLMMYRNRNGQLQIYLGHPGGPYFANKDDESWGIPKGGLKPGEDLLTAACREFKEETGIESKGPYHALGSIVQASGKVVHGWAFEGDADDTQPPKSNLTTIEWPPRSGQTLQVPELDRAVFFDIDTARRKLRPAQTPWLARLVAALVGIREQGGACKT